jgi:hypothetical protein
MTADETSGSLFLLTCLAQFEEWKILDGMLQSKGNSTNLQEVLEALEALCCFDAWTWLDKYWKIEDEYADKAQESIVHLLEIIKRHLPCVEGCRWKLVTFHNITHLVSDMKKYGKPKEANTKVGEKNHKHFAKSLGHCACKQHSTFTRQIAQ